MRRRNPHGYGAPRAECVHVEGTWVRFTWPCGHFRTEDLNSKRLPLARRHPSEAAARRIAGWWGNGDGVNAGFCPTCRKKTAQ